MEKLLKRSDLAIRWGCSIETVKRREKAGILKPIVLGRLVRFRLDDVIKLEENMKKDLEK